MEGGCEKLARAVRLVAARKAAGEGDYVSALYCGNYCLDAFLNVLRSAVFDYENFRFRTRQTEGAFGIQLAVGAGEGRYKHAGLCRLNSDIRIFKPYGTVAVGRFSLCGSGCGEYAVKPLRIRPYNLRLFCRFAVKDKVLFNRFAEQSVFQPLENAFVLGRGDNIAVALLKQPAIAAREFEAEAVAEAGFDDCRSRAALFHNGCKIDLPPAYARINGIIQRYNRNRVCCFRLF